MRAEYYADLYRQYQNFVRNYGDNEIFRIASVLEMTIITGQRC